MDTNQPTIPETNDLPPAVAGQEFQAPEVSVNVAPVENNPPVVPPTPKTKGKLMPILLIILILVLLGVGGLFAYKNFFVTAPEPTPTPISTPESTPDPTADWKTYTNTEYKFSLKYPEGVKNSVAINGPFTTFKFTFIGPVQEASGRTQAELSDGYMITINVAPVTEAITMQTLQLGAEKGRQGILNAGYGANCSVSETKSGILDSVPTVEYTTTNCMGNYINILTFKGSVQYQITGLYTSSEYELIVNQILSTFKFNGQTPTTKPSSTPNPTTSWKTFSNTDFSFKYPAEWTSNQSGTTMTADVDGAKIFTFDRNSPMYNECMVLGRTETTGDKMIKYFGYAYSGEACSNKDEIGYYEAWITKAGGEGFQPGIIYRYNTTAYANSYEIFKLILSTFKFVQ